MTTRYCDDFSYVNVFRTRFLPKIRSFSGSDFAKNLISKSLSQNQSNPKKIAHFLRSNLGSIRRISCLFRITRFIPLGASKKIPFRFGDGSG